MDNSTAAIELRQKLQEAVRFEGKNMENFTEILKSLTVTAIHNSNALANMDIDKMSITELRQALGEMQELRTGFPVDDIHKYVAGYEVEVPECACGKCSTPAEQPEPEVRTEVGQPAEPEQEAAPGGIKVVIVGQDNIPSGLLEALKSGMLTKALHSGGVFHS